MKLPRLLFLLVSVASASVLAAQTQTAKPPTVAMAGIVVDAVSGLPVEGALVSTWRAPGNPNMRRAVTDTAGHFVIADVEVGRRELRAEAAGYDVGRYGQILPTGSSQQLDVNEHTRPVNLRVSMWKLGVIAGVATDGAADPLVGVTVQAWRRQLDPRGFGRVHFARAGMTTTDDRGQFRIPVPTGDYVVVLPPAVFGTGPAAETEAAVVHESFAAQSIVAFFDTGASRPIPPVAAGRLLTYPSALFPATGTLPLDVIRVSPSELRNDVALRSRPVAAFTIRGRVLGVSDVKGLRVELKPTWAESFAGTGQDVFLSATGLVGENGRFSLVGVPPGDYVLRTFIGKAPRPRIGSVQSQTGQSLAMGDVGIEPPSGQTPATLWAEQAVSISTDLDLTINVQRGFSLSGTVTFDEPPPGPADVQKYTVFLLAASPAPSAPPSAAVRPDGSFTTGEYPPGQYQLVMSGGPIGWHLKAATRDGRDLTDRPFNLTEHLTDVHVAFTRMNSTVTGTVRNGVAQPDASASVLLFPQDYQQRLSDGIRPAKAQRVRVATDGQFSFANVPAGDYFVVAVPEQTVDEYWQSASWLSSRARAATKIHVFWGSNVVQDVVTQVVK